MKCTRCSGFMVPDYFCGGETIFNAWAYEGGRCVNCGAIANARSAGWTAPRDARHQHNKDVRRQPDRRLRRRVGT